MRRARKPAQKTARRQAILKSAEALLRTDRVGLPSVSTIAAETGIAKGTIYLYFRSKEEIYLSLLGVGFTRWGEVLNRAVEVPTCTPDRFITSFVHFCVRNPKTLYLACIGPLILEPNVREPNLRAYKKDVVRTMGQASELLAERFEGLCADDASRMLHRSFALATGLWQYAHPTDSAARVLENEEFSGLKIDYEIELQEALESLWRGSS